MIKEMAHIRRLRLQVRAVAVSPDLRTHASDLSVDGVCIAGMCRECLHQTTTGYRPISSEPDEDFGAMGMGMSLGIIIYLLIHQSWAYMSLARTGT